MTETTATQPLLTWSVPSLDGGRTVELAAQPGHAVVLVGPNGAGKSALSHWMYVNLSNQATQIIRILAHRQIWLRYSGSDGNSESHQSMADNIRSWDRDARSRVYLEYDQQRASKLLFDLVAEVNYSNAQAAKKYKNGEVGAGSVPETLLEVVSRIFTFARLDLTFDLTRSGTIDAVRDDISYPISDMSDGEKGAFILAAQVLLAPNGSVLIVDEPERHLHRAVSASFISALMNERKDSAFILMTHDLDLISRLPTTNITIGLINAVMWGPKQPNQTTQAIGWELIIDPAGSAELPEPARKAILGGRRKLLLVEGGADSVDVALYVALYPEWTVVPCGGSEDVCRAVAGLTNSTSHHWISAHGIIDGDARTEVEVAALAHKAITVLPVSEVESLYYLATVVETICTAQAAALSLDPAALQSAATKAALNSLTLANLDHLASVNAEKEIRRNALAQLPTREVIRKSASKIDLSINSPYPAERQQLDNLQSAHDYEAIVRSFSVRDTPFLNRVATSLKFRNRADYQARVLVLLHSNPELLQQVREVVGWDGSDPAMPSSSPEYAET